MTPTWTVEMYTDARGHCPVERKGVEPAGSSWLKSLKQGLYEFRVRSTAAEIVRMYGDAGRVPPEDSETILLRVFVAFHGNRVVLLLDGYDKGSDASPKRQQREIAAARRLLTKWKAQQLREAKHKRLGR